MQPNSIHMIGATGKTADHVDNAFGFAESNALFRTPSNRRRAV